MHNKIFNQKNQKPTRQKLRSAMPAPEQYLWQRLRNKQLGVRFRRQQGIGRYIVDFYCPERALVIEVDGDCHYTDSAQEYDRIRDEFMVSLGLNLLRFSNADIMKNLDGVLSVISCTLRAPLP
jgi:very-short-patch-repair endonuclease